MHQQDLQSSILSLLLIGCSQQAAHHDPIGAGATCQTSAYFSRRGGDAEPLISALNQAQNSIRAAIYGLTHPGIVDALIAARVVTSTSRSRQIRFRAPAEPRRQSLQNSRLPEYRLKFPSRRGYFITSLPCLMAAA